ncbi:hypothetical protein A464_1615 [Salmonella bongori N268-08]|uniref:Uncharacterized protein n=1 Tax=Salmonella bongori N268-08 TaxID=1197719 RepID=S5N872_SALBN|nr:hypothetical protein A464_1615 [Salmonella bongori N268-08]
MWRGVVTIQSLMINLTGIARYFTLERYCLMAGHYLKVYFADRTHNKVKNN